MLLRLQVVELSFVIERSSRVSHQVRFRNLRLAGLLSVIGCTTRQHTNEYADEQGASYMLQRLRTHNRRQRVLYGTW